MKLDLAEYFITSKATKTIDEKNKDEPNNNCKKIRMELNVKGAGKYLDDKCAKM